MTQLLIPQAGAWRARLQAGAVTDIISPAPRDIWRGVLADDPGANALQTPEYVDAVLAATGGTDVSRFYQLRDGRQLLLPLVRRRTALGPAVDTGYPGGYGRGGLLATGGLLADDVRAVVSDLRGQSMSTRIGGTPQTSEQWAAGRLSGVAEELRQVEVIDLEGLDPHDPESFRARRLPSEVRSSLLRATQLGVEVEVDATGRLVDVFHDIYRAWVERWIPRSGLPPVLARRIALRREPLPKLRALAAHAGQACRIFVAWHKGRPVAASVMLTYGAHSIGWRSYSIDELAAPVSADVLTQVVGIEDALASGCRYVDLGPAGEAGLFQPEHLGSAPRSVVDLRIETPGFTRLRTANDRARGVLVQVLTKRPARPLADEQED